MYEYHETIDHSKPGAITQYHNERKGEPDKKTEQGSESEREREEEEAVESD